MLKIAKPKHIKILPKIQLLNNGLKIVFSVKFIYAWVWLSFCCVPEAKLKSCLKLPGYLIFKLASSKVKYRGTFNQDFSFNSGIQQKMSLNFKNLNLNVAV